MSDLIDRQAAIDVVKGIDSGFVKYIEELPSAQPETEERTLTEDDYAYCMNCDHVEMCRWYPMYGCEFKSRPSVQPDLQECEKCIFKPFKQFQPEPQWIPCSERLPERCQNYIVTDFGTVSEVYYDSNGRWFTESGNKLKDVTAWMPLPEPYNPT